MLEARQSRKQAVIAGKQGKVVLVFTVVTIIFVSTRHLSSIVSRARKVHEEPKLTSKTILASLDVYDYGVYFEHIELSEEGNSSDKYSASFYYTRWWLRFWYNWYITHVQTRLKFRALTPYSGRDSFDGGAYGYSCIQSRHYRRQGCKDEALQKVF